MLIIIMIIIMITLLITMIMIIILYKYGTWVSAIKIDVARNQSAIFV